MYLPCERFIIKTTNNANSNAITAIISILPGVPLYIINAMAINEKIVVPIMKKAISFSTIINDKTITIIEKIPLPNLPILGTTSNIQTIPDTNNSPSATMIAIYING